MSFAANASKCLKWCKQVTEDYPKEARVKGWTSKNWLSGSVFCAMLHATDPTSLDYGQMHEDGVEAQARLRVCFELAEKTYGVDSLLDADDWAALSDTEPKSLKLYMHSLVPRLQKSRGERKSGDVADVTQLLSALTMDAGREHKSEQRQQEHKGEAREEKKNEPKSEPLPAEGGTRAEAHDGAVDSQHLAPESKGSNMTEYEPQTKSSTRPGTDAHGLYAALIPGF